MKIKTIAVVAACAPLLAAVSLRGADDLPHPILSISSNSGSAANTVLSTWTESQYTNDFTPRYGPRNEGYGFGSAVVSGDTGWTWSQNSPTNITSTPSGTVFPNAAYPVQTQAVTTFSGDTVQAPFYFKAGSTSSKTFLFNVISYHQLGKRDTDFGNLSGAYVNTGLSQSSRDSYARRIAIELLDWARWYPDYTLTGKNSATYINTSPTYILSADAQLASDHNGLAHEWNDTPLKAFDSIYDSAALTNLSAEMGFDVRDYITTNIFFFEGDFFVNHVPISVAIGSNLSGPYDVLPEVARVLNRPDYIVWMDQYLTAAITDNINRDGIYEEGQGYSIGYINANITAAQNTKNYFLTRPATNGQFIAISNRAVQYAGALQYGQQQWSMAALPDGQLASFGDTPFDTYFTARNYGYSIALGSYGHVTMGAGSSSSTAVQVNQQYAGNQNHMRSDTTAFALWAFNNEYLGNVRYYNGAIGRNWGEVITEKNAVTIDRSDLTPFPDTDQYGNANLTLYEPGNNGLAMTELDGYRDYSGKASRYQRLLFLNTVDLAKPYIVDVFRVTGGTNHDYTFHGSVRWTQAGNCSFPLVTNNNVYPMLETGDAAWSLASDTPIYGFFRGVNSNAAPGNFYLTFTDTNRSSARDTRLWMTADPNAYNVYLGWTPVPARDNTVPTNFFNSMGLTRPSAIIRHRVSSGPLSDLFVSVVEPFNAGVTNIVSVQRLPMSGNSLESCALQITFKDGRVDTYVVNLRNPKIAGANTGAAIVSTADGQYVLNGRVGMTVDRSNGDPRVWTINASDFKYPNRELSTPTNMYYSGWIAGETREFDGNAYDAFTTTTPLPVGTALRGESFSFTHGQMSGGPTNISELFKIDQIVLSNNLYYVCFTNDHYLEITNGITSAEQVAPLRTFTTSNSFEIALTAYAGQISPIADQNIPPGGSSGPIAFNFGNLGTTAGASLQVAATSSNQTLIPNSNLVIGGSGTSRTITVTPAAGQTGSSLVTVSVTDGVWTNSRSFNAIVANFALTTTPTSQAVLAGGSVNFTNVMVATNGTGTVSFGVNGLPSGATANFNPATTAGAGTNVLSITTASNTPAGAYPLAITATTDSQSATNTVALVVNVITPTPGWITWTGGSGSGNFWNDSANWSAAILPGNSLAFSGITRLNNTNNTAAGTTYSNLVFNPGAGAFTLNGNSVTLITGITNNSSVAQTVAVGVSFGNNISLNGGNSGLVIAGGLTDTANTSTAINTTFSGLGTLVNNLSAPTSTNVFLTSAGANWTIADNASSSAMSVLATLNVYNGGTLNFGTADSAPNLTLTGNDSTSGQRQVIGNGTGTSTFNMVNGTLTSGVRLNVGNGTGGAALNVSGGTLSLSGAGLSTADNNFATIGSVTVSGGLLHLTAGTFFVATRGTGTLTVNGGTVDARTLDVSRGIFASGGTSSHGTVNLDGGTLTADRVATATASSAAGGSPTAVFNFNGGTLKATSASTTWFLGGSAGGSTPIPITANVKSGGAIIDDGGNSITVGEPLQHDSSLGGNPDGGLTKLDTGTLTLAAAATYNGNTTVTAGTLALTGNGAIASSANISVAAGATLDASGRSDGKLTLSATQTLSGNGNLAGNVVIGGTISPGADSVGAMTNSGPFTFAAGGKYLFDMADAIGQEGTNWDLLAATGALDCEASGASPFTVQLRSIDGDLSDGNPGAADFGNDSAQSWVIASGSGVTNFAANKFSVDDGAFQNDLAGGYFVVQTNSSGLLLAFVPNQPPSANDTAFYLPRSGVLQVPVAALSVQWSDPDGDPVALAGVNTSSTNGVNNVGTDGNYIYYTNANSLADAILYTVGDVRTNPPAVYRPGDTVRTAPGIIHVLPPPALNLQPSTLNSQFIFSGTGGIPGGNIYLLTSPDVSLPLAQWQCVATNSFDGNGNFDFTNAAAAAGQQEFYLLKLE